MSQADGAITIQGSDEFSGENGEVSISGINAGGVVIINGRVVTPDNYSGQWVKTPPAQIVLNVPYRQNLNLRTSGGNIRIDRLQGQFNARASGGDIEADDVDGSVEVRTSGGGIASDFPDLAPENAAGRARIEKPLNGGGPDLVVRTTGGSIRIRRLDD